MLSEQDLKKTREFFSYFSELSEAYPSVILYAVAYRKDDDLFLIAARLHIATKRKTNPNRLFSTENITAFEIGLDTTTTSIEEIFFQLIGENGLSLPDIGCVKTIIPDNTESVHASIMLPLEGGDNSMKLSISCNNRHRLSQDIYASNINYKLKSADLPYESLQELCADYHITLQNQQQGSMIDIILDPVATLWENSTVVEYTATFGLILPKLLDRKKAKIGFCILDNTNKASRGNFLGENLAWEDVPDDTSEPIFLVGKLSTPINYGAAIQYFVSYNNKIQDVQWRSDPNAYNNPRLAAFQTIDSELKILRSYLNPESKGSAAENFEQAISWLFWLLGFSGLAFIRNKKVIDAVDSIFVTDNGDFLIVECTIGLIDSEKRSKFLERSYSIRKQVDASHKNARFLSMIITSMSKNEVTKDIDQAEKDGCIAWTQENLYEMLNINIKKNPDANLLFDKLFEENRIASDPNNRPFWSSR